MSLQYAGEKDFCTVNLEILSLLEKITRKGVHKILQQSLELEVEEYF